MAWRAELRPSAFKALSKLERAGQEVIRAALDGLLAELDARGRPVASDVKKLKGTQGDYRLRAGDFRVIYRLEGDRLVVLVVTIGHRRDVYR